MRKDCSWVSQAIIVIIAGMLVVVGYICGYQHVIASSEAWIMEGTTCIALEVDGRQYHYCVPKHALSGEYGVVHW